ncbi:MAG TPA: Calx-beta domain-containing protein [Solimonas sp.]|nr:Calx-beta domain-containing protein [Solimonas sp.]
MFTKRATVGALRNAVVAAVLGACTLPAAAAVKLEFAATVYDVNEGAGQVVLSVARSGGAVGAVSLSYATVEKTAKAGSDFTASSGTLSWPDGDSAPKTITVPLLNDLAYEALETFKVTLSAPTGGAVLGAYASTVYVNDNDVGLGFGAKSFTVGEGGAAGITVYRKGNLSPSVSVSYTVSNGSAQAGSDYTTVSGKLSWPPNNGQPKTFALPTLQDALQEPGETVTITLGNPVGATIDGAATASLTIADDDAPAPGTGNPVMFVTQVPVSGFLVVTSPFGAHEGWVYKAPRGGDLMIRYADGALRNLTQEAGYGMSAFQGGNAIAVRQPSVHWNGQKAVFSMVVGGNTQQYQSNQAKWQLYEVTGFMPGQTVQITKVPGQPAGFNNIAPTYASDGQIIFTSDRPRNGSMLLYPQRDEYESANIESGLWKLNPAAATFKLIEHAPSGASYPSVDSAGRVIFTKWDHLQRDQQADADAFSAPDVYKYGAFNYDSETQVNPPPVHSMMEFFPELRRAAYSKPFGAGYDGTSIDPNYPYNGHTFNHFFPWMLNQDGSEEETLNHVGRHELGGAYTDGSFRNDPALHYVFQGQFSGGTQFLQGDGGMFHLREDPAQPGLFYGSHAPEFGTHTAGDIVRIFGSKDTNPEDMRLEVVMKRAGNGRMRNPLPLANGQLVVVHTSSEDTEKNLGSSTAPVYNYDFRLRVSKVVGSERVPGAFVTGGLVKSINYWSPDEKVNWSGTLWELDPVEVRSAAVPARTLAPSLPLPEAQVLSAQGVNETLLRNWLHSNKLALVVMRNVTTRDRADQQQPFNLAVPGGVSTLGQNGAPYNIARMQFFQGDQVRGYASGKPPQQGGTPSPGRRVLPVPMHEPAAIGANPPIPANGLPGSVAIAPDGSVAAFVPAQRAMAWQLVDGTGLPIVRERNWLSFKPGETRSCPSCHGLNKVDQAKGTAPKNQPQALATLLTNWKKVVRNNCPVSGGTGTWTYPAAFSACDEGSQYRIQACIGGNGCCAGYPATETQACAP